jgi:hypothetical protein
MTFDKLKQYPSPIDPLDKVYNHADIKSHYKELLQLAGGSNCFLAINHFDKHTLDFALFDFFMRSTNEPDSYYRCIFYGWGVPELMEMRHIWWAPHEDSAMRGYTFYLNRKAVTEAFKILDRYFE